MQIDFPILSQPSKETEMITPRAAVTTSRPATATNIAKNCKVTNPWACNCSVLLHGKKGKPRHSAACKRQVWMDTIIQLQKQNKAIKTSDLPSPTEGEVVLRIGSAAHLPNLIYKGKTWREL